MLIDDYFTYQIDYQKKYGNQCIVLMQVGSFFEFYGVDNDIEKIGNVQIVTELLNIQLTRRNKAILENSRSNSLMAGFPLVSLKRFINILLNNNYTIILIEQVSEPPNPRREITQIYSPGTYIEEINNSDPNHISCIYLTEESCYKSGSIIFSFGMASIDLSTGYNIIYENNMLYFEKAAFLEELYRFIEAYNPKEIVIYYNTCNLKKLKLEDIREKININNRIIHFRDNIAKFENINFQNAFLEKLFPKHGLLNVIEYLDLEKTHFARLAYISLLQFAFEHNENIINKLKKPAFWEYNDHLILYNNAIYQLNIVSANGKNTGSYNSLYDIIQKTSTNMGKRLLKYRLMNPISNIDELNKRYGYIELFLKKESKESKENKENKENKEKTSFSIIHLEKYLNEIIDIERLHRKIVLQILHPYEFLNLTYSYENIVSCLSYVHDNANFNNELFGLDIQYKISFNEFIEEYQNIFDLKELGKYGLSNIGGSIFKIGVYEEIDKIQQQIDSIHEYFKNTCSYLSNLIEAGSDFVKIEHNDRDGYFLYTTKKRSIVLTSKLEKMDKKNKPSASYEIKKYNGSNIKIVCPEIIQKSVLLNELLDNIKSVVKEKYLITLAFFGNKYQETLYQISQFIAIVDVLKCGAKIAKMYNYHAPTILDKNCGKSYFCAQKIRHPIIELIHEKVEYVSNDLELLHGECNGILLYGVNGSGKSSLSKAVGCNIILAQMGFYVAADSFEYYPYKKIFTRINGDDNIFKGLSSFAVEMDELRSILKYSDDRSIVLGDEICKGTEETSALSIVSSSIARFCKNNVNFIMATHFHKLYSMNLLEEQSNVVKFMHLSIDYDKENQSIIYGRKLLDGPGSTYYGIEIADFIICDPEFILNAKEVRCKILNTSSIILDEKKTSNYNSKLYVDKCSICGVTGSSYPLDTHHIKEQHTFDETIHHDFHKNKLANLVVLCKEHHDAVHHGNLEIVGYK